MHPVAGPPQPRPLAGLDAAVPPDAAVQWQASMDALGDASVDARVDASREGRTSDPSPLRSTVDGPPPGTSQIPDRLTARTAFFDGLFPSTDGRVDLAFSIPPDAGGLVLSVAGPCTVGLAQWVGPDQQAWFPSGAYMPAADASSGGGSPLTLLLEGVPTRALSGWHRVSLWTDAVACPLAADVVHVGPDGQPAPLSIPVRLFWGGPGAMPEATRAAFDAALADANRIFARAAIRFAASSPVSVPIDSGDDAPARPDGSIAWSALLDRLPPPEAGHVDLWLWPGALERVIAGAHGGAGGPSMATHGLSTSIPLPPARRDRARRGAVVVDTASLGGYRGGELLAHELGHGLGLSHTSSPDGERHDALADTPECPAVRADQLADDGTWRLRAIACLDRDGENLMFPVPRQDEGAQRALSHAQLHLLRTGARLLLASPGE